MNTKKAKALRKEIGYHPTDPRFYNSIVKKYHIDEKGVQHQHNTLEVSPRCSRALYLEMKKEMRAG